MRKSGFNLIEIAIVLAVLGAVIGGIYVAAGSVYEKNKISRADTQVTNLVKGMRLAYANSRYSGAVSANKLQEFNVVPADMPITANTIRGAYGAVTISDNNIPGRGNTFNLNMNSVPREGCIYFMAQKFVTPQDWQRQGLCGRTANGTNMDAGTTIAAATTACTQLNDNSLDFCFFIRQ